MTINSKRHLGVRNIWRSRPPTLSTDQRSTIKYRMMITDGVSVQGVAVFDTAARERERPGILPLHALHIVHDATFGGYYIRSVF